MWRRLLFTVAALIALGSCGGSDDDAGVSAAEDDAAASLVDDEGGDAVTSGVVDDDGGGSDDAGGDPPDPCELLSVDDLSAQGIAAASGPTPTDGARFPECTFADGDGNLVLQVQVFAPSDAGGASGGQVDVAGLGEAAYYVEAARTLTIDLSDGSQIVLYSPFGVDPEDPMDVLVGLGRIASG